MTNSGWIIGLQIAVGLLTAWLGWSVRTFKASILKDIELVGQRAEQRAEDLERRMASAESEIKTKVADEEWLRESMRLRNDVQRMGETLARIEGKTDSTLMVASAINRVASAMENQADSNQES